MNRIPTPPILSLAFSRIMLVAMMVPMLSACKVPDDPEGTTRNVKEGTLKVGALVAPLDDVDTAAIARIADALQVESDIRTGDPHNLFALLEAGELHVVAGRIPSNTPFASQVGLTNPLGRIAVGSDTEDRVLAIRKGENLFLVTINRAIRELSR